MKILLVTSQITYVPNNCQDFFKHLLEGNSKHITGLVILQNLTLNLVTKILWLYPIGCVNLANTLSRNIICELLLKRREELFKKYNLPIIKVKSMNNSQISNLVKENRIDLIINLRTRCIYEKEILESPSFGCVNIHHGILPKYRGVFCDLYALHENRPAGITIHKMDEKIDEGEILYTKQISNNSEKNYINYLSKTGQEEATQVIKLINYIEQNGKLPNGIKNKSDEYVFSTTPKISKIKDMRKGGLIL